MNVLIKSATIIDAKSNHHNTTQDILIEKGIISEKFAQQMSIEDIHMLIFEPGFSNAETITEVSGRGVGMDVVKKATESIGGKLSVETEIGKGSTITLSLPSSMAVKGALLFEMEKQEFAVPLTYTEAVISIYKKDITWSKFVNYIFNFKKYVLFINNSNSLTPFFKKGMMSPLWLKLKFLISIVNLL